MSGEVKRDEILRSRCQRSSEASREDRFTTQRTAWFPQHLRARNFFACQVLNRICTTGPQVFHNARRYRGLRSQDAGKMHHRLIMVSCVRCLIALIVCVLRSGSGVHAADEAMLFRVFLTDGSSVVTYGEFARVADQVVLSVPVGGTAQDPRLHAVTLRGLACRLGEDRSICRVSPVSALCRDEG